jgi:hypothetical protein
MLQKVRTQSDASNSITKLPVQKSKAKPEDPEESMLTKYQHSTHFMHPNTDPSPKLNST